MVDKKLSEFSQITPDEIAKLICLYLDENNAIKNGVVDFAVLDALLVHKSGEETITGNKTFSGNAVFSGNATFNNSINANISGNSATATNATNATNDASGNNIGTTYATKTEANGKMDNDAGNATSVAKQTIIGWNVPDYNSAISVEHDLSTNYTCPYLGYYVCLIDKTAGNNAPALKVNGVTVGAANYSNTFSTFYTTVFCNVGDIISAESAYIRKVVTYIPPKGV